MTIRSVRYGHTLSLRGLELHLIPHFTPGPQSYSDPDPKEIPNARRLRQVLTKNYRTIANVYNFYSSLSPTMSFAISERLYYQFVYDARIPDGSFTMIMVEKLFILGTDFLPVLGRKACWAWSITLSTIEVTAEPAT